jgi:hypothetical protein
MPLNTDRLYASVSQMAVALPDILPMGRIADARAFFLQADLGVLREKLRQRERGAAKIPWLVAEPVNTLTAILPVPPLPADLAVVASDGSTIPPDRHSPVRYYVLNVGYVVLVYGSQPSAQLGAQEWFCYEEKDLYFDPQDKRIPLEGARLGIHMGVKELSGLLEATDLAPQPVVALRDGSLILWSLHNEEKAFQVEYLGQFLGALDAFRERGVPVASYVSYPGSNDIINCLRLLLCDQKSGGCTNCPQENDAERLCRSMGGIRDRQLFEGLLEPGERSDIFQSQSAILSHYKEHQIQFFYLDVGGEIARVEAPQWVMSDPEMLDLVHGTVYDQCRRSAQYPPYPPVLIEAHEQAVISTGDRRMVEGMVEKALAAQGIFYMRSAKDTSKKSRGV